MEIVCFKGKSLTKNEKEKIIMKNNRYTEIKKRMGEIAEDIIKSLAGIEVSDLESKKEEYRALYQEIVSEEEGNLG